MSQQTNDPKSTQSGHSALTGNENICVMPTREAVEATPGTPISKEELAKLQAQGQLPPDFNISQSSAKMHKVKSGDQDFIVIMVDPPPCGCVRLANGKKKRCRKHKKEWKERRKAKKAKKMVKDDDSDRNKVVELRHAGDSYSDEDKTIEGAFTPDKICALGPAGVAVLVDVDKPQGADLGPRAKVDKPMKGILVRGPHDTPQFIPEEKIEKDANGEPKNHHYTRGQLVKGPHGEAIFYADGQCQPDQKGNPTNFYVSGVDRALQKRIGDTVYPPCEVEVNEKGMPEFKQITNTSDFPRDKHATVGILTKNSDGVVVFTQTGGQVVGCRESAQDVSTTPNDKVPPCELIGKVVAKKDGVNRVIPPNQAPKQDEKFIGNVLQGNYSEPVLIKDPKAGAGGAASMKAIQSVEATNKTNAPQIENANILIQSKLQNKTPEEIKKEQAQKMPVASEPQEVYSSSFYGATAYRPNMSVYARPAGIQTKQQQVQVHQQQQHHQQNYQQQTSAFMLKSQGGTRSVFITGGAGGGGPSSSYSRGSGGASSGVGSGAGTGSKSTGGTNLSSPHSVYL